MDLINTISPYEYIGNSLGKINQNFINLQRLPVTLSAKYIQIDNFITSLRSQIVTDNLQVSGDASVKEIFRAQGDVFLGSNERGGEKVTIYSWPIYLPNAINSSQSLVFGRETIGGGVLVNLYRTSVGSRADTLQTDGDFRVVNNFTAGGNVWLSGDLQVGTDNTKQVIISSGNVHLSNITSTTNALRFGTTGHANLYRSAADTLKTDSKLNVGTLDTGTTNNVVTHNTNELRQRTINERVWDTNATFISATPTLIINRIVKSDGRNSVTNSNITDDGTNVTITGHLNLDNTKTVGTATLGSGGINGYVEIPVTGITAGAIVLVTRRVGSGTLGMLGASSRTDTVCISSLSNATTLQTGDTSIVNWFAVN